MASSSPSTFLPLGPPAASTAPYHDTYPWTFWPPLPWDAEIPLPEPPHNWRRDHPPPAYRAEQIRPDDPEREEKLRELADYRNRWTAVSTKWVASGAELWGEESGGTWEGVAMLGTGSYGSAALWVKKNRDGDVIDRMVAKDCTTSRTEWHYPPNWRDRLPRELWVHERIDAERAANPIPAFRSLVRHRGYRLQMRAQRYRLYLDYYAKGDLHSAMKPIAARVRAAVDEGTYLGDVGLPEQFIWHVFGELVDAMIVLRDGGEAASEDASGKGKGREKAKEKATKWDPIVHRDIHMLNIFLDEPQEGDPWVNEEMNTDKWPRIVLGDFGLAFSTITPGTEDDPSTSDNPSLYVFHHYDERYAPELQPDNTTPITPLSDIWLLGALLFNLITSRSHGPPLPDDPLADNPDAEYLAINDYFFLGPSDVLSGARFPQQLHYSEQLRDMVRDCLQREPMARPTLESLRDEIAAEKATWRERVRDTGLDFRGRERVERAWGVGRKRRASPERPVRLVATKKEKRMVVDLSP